MISMILLLNIVILGYNIIKYKDYFGESGDINLDLR